MATGRSPLLVFGSRQCQAQNLSHRAFRQTFRELDLVWDFVRGNVCAQEIADGVGKFVRGSRRLIQDHYSANLIADLRVRFGNHRCLDNGGMILQGVLDFRRRDENAAAFEAIVASTGDEEVTFLILISEIAFVRRCLCLSPLGRRRSLE